MANEVDYSPCKYTGNGLTTDFSFSWKVMDIQELIVELENISTGDISVLVLGTDYTANLNAVGGSVSLTTAPTSAYYIHLKRKTSNYQSKGFSTSTGFQGSEIEKSFDKFSCCLQDMDYNIEKFKTDFSEEVGNDITTISNSVDTANATASMALLTANNANAKSDTAISTANTASSNASTAVSTANSANTKADNAVSTANTASTNASNAVSTSNSASSTATAASNKVNSLESTIGTVIEAASKINQLETAVTTATNAATTATNKADIATQKAQEATQAAASIVIPTKLSDFTDDLGNSPTHTHSQYEETTNKGFAGGYAELDSTGKVPTAQLPELGSTTEITYADSSTADLEEVVYQTTSTYAGRTTFPNTQIDVVEDIGDNYNPLYFANAKTISASTNYSYSQNGTFCTGSSSVATVTITKSGSSVTVYGNVVRIPRGCTFTSSVAGKFFFDDNYYGYLAN